MTIGVDARCVTYYRCDSLVAPILRDFLYLCSRLLKRENETEETMDARRHLRMSIGKNYLEYEHHCITGN